MNKSETIGTAIVRYICPVCEKPVESESEVVLNTRLSKAHADKVKDLHGKTAGYAKTICNECREQVGDGIYLIGIDPDKTENMNNPYRTGQILGITRDAFERIFDRDAPKGQAAWTEEQIILWIQKEHEDL